MIIVSYNSAEWLGPCLESIYGHAGAIQLEVIVVDNASTDGSAELVEGRFPNATVVRTANRGFAAGNNAGLARTSAEFVLFLNPDTVILDGTLAEMVGMLRTRPRVGLIGCRQVDPDGAVLPTIRRFPSALRYACAAVGTDRLGLSAPWAGERVLTDASYRGETPCDWVSGSFMLGRTDLVRAAGAFDERYFLYSEEPDLCLGLRRLGWEVLYVPLMTIRHYAGKAGYDARLVAQDAYSRRQYLEKHLLPVHREVAIAALALGYAVRAVAPGSDRRRRDAARRAVRTLLGRTPPPFAGHA